jgi:hypothetical protein
LVWPAKSATKLGRNHRTRLMPLGLEFACSQCVNTVSEKKNLAPRDKIAVANFIKPFF